MTGLVQPASPVSVGSVAQLALSLAAIVALILAVSWVLKRLKLGAIRGRGEITVIDQLSLGPRERIVLVRVGESQVLIGVGAGGLVGLTPLAAPIAIESPRRFHSVRRSPARIHEAPRTRPMNARIVRAGLMTLSLACLPAVAALADPSLPALAIKSGADGVQTYSLTFQVLILMTVLTLLPAILLAMTAFTRIIIVLSILRQALGMATTPSNQVLTGLALFLTFFVMSPALDQSYSNGIKPYMDGQLAGEVAITRTVEPLKKFMLAQARENDLQLFTKLSGKDQFAKPEDVPLERAGADLPHQRAEDRVRDRFHGVHSFPGDRPRGRERADVDGHDDALAGARVVALQNHAVRGGRRLDAAHRNPGGEFSPMTPETVMDLAHSTLTVTAMIAAPLLLTALVTGLLIGMLQAATQINEATLSFIPKLLVLVLALFITGPWILRVLVDFTHNLYAGIPAMIG